MGAGRAGYWPDQHPYHDADTRANQHPHQHTRCYSYTSGQYAHSDADTRKYGNGNAEQYRNPFSCHSNRNSDRTTLRGTYQEKRRRGLAPG